MDKTLETEYTLQKSTHVPHYIKIAMVDDNGQEVMVSDVLRTPVQGQFKEQLEALNRGLIAAKCPDGIF